MKKKHTLKIYDQIGLRNFSNSSEAADLKVTAFYKSHLQKFLEVLRQYGKQTDVLDMFKPVRLNEFHEIQQDAEELLHEIETADNTKSTWGDKHGCFNHIQWTFYRIFTDKYTIRTGTFNQKKLKAVFEN